MAYVVDTADMNTGKVDIFRVDSFDDAWVIFSAFRDQHAGERFMAARIWNGCQTEILNKWNSSDLYGPVMPKSVTLFRNMLNSKAGLVSKFGGKTYIHQEGRLIV